MQRTLGHIGIIAGLAGCWKNFTSNGNVNSSSSNVANQSSNTANANSSLSYLNVNNSTSNSNTNISSQLLLLITAGFNSAGVWQASTSPLGEKQSIGQYVRVGHQSEPVMNASESTGYEGIFKSIQ